MSPLKLEPGVAAALATAVLFGASTPLAKPLLGQTSPWLLAALLYLGSGLGLWLVRRQRKASAVHFEPSECWWLAGGNAVKVVPIRAELTTQEAADLLNVSRPHLVKLLESGVLRFHKAGKHRRVRFSDLMAYKTAQEQGSTAAMEELAAQAQVLQMGYE